MNDSIVSDNTASISAGTSSPLVDTTANATAAATMASFMKSRLHARHVVLLIGYAVLSVCCFIMAIYLHVTRTTAIKRSTKATRSAILPAFKPLLIVLGLFTGAFTAFLIVALETDMFEYRVSKLATEVFYCVRQFVFLSVVVFMFQTSVSLPSLWRSTAISLMLSTYTLPIAWLMVEYGNPDDLYAVITSSRAAMLLFYGFVFVRPPCRASKRSLREFCVYVFIYYALLFTYNHLLRKSKLELGFNLTYFTAIYATFYPLVVFRVLKADTAHWRGNGERSLLMQPLLRQNDSIPEGAASEGFHVLLEMHRSNVIDIADLKLDKRCTVGSGTNVEWISGMLHSEVSIAVKAFTPPIFSDSFLSDIAYEAAICGALKHPNIVKFYGICVSPPTIGLVVELCEGSLEELVSATSRRPQHSHRQQLLISVAYMLDAARAVAYMHSFSPPFLHRNIRPSSFVVDADNNVKLTNFSGTQSLPSAEEACTDDVYTNPLAINGSVQYMAPELINGQDGQSMYSEATDVYALAVTMWDILHPNREKYHVFHANHAKICECVTQGQRPDLDKSLHPDLREIIEAAWHADPRQRPSAHIIVNMLMAIQEQLATVLALHLREGVDDVQMVRHNLGEEAIEVMTFTGASAVACMEEKGYVASRGEGVRLLNTLLDAYVVHPLKQSRRFEGLADVYYFDEDTIDLNEPLGGIKLRTLQTLDCDDDDATEHRITVSTASKS